MRGARSLVLVAALAPAAAWGQAAVQSDTPVPRRSGGASSTSVDALPRGGAGRDGGVPNPVTGPGSPAATGTGAAGTGPSGTMAAPGR